MPMPTSTDQSSTAAGSGVTAEISLANAKPVATPSAAPTVLSVALVVDNVLNGLARPFFGWVSDQLGRELTMGIAFFLGLFAAAN